jgi:hypothetical protein
VSSNSQRFALLPAGFAAHACKLRLATVRIVARRVRCPRLQAPSRNGSHCCPPGSLPTPEAATRGGGREAQRARSPAGGDDDDECILYLSAPGGAASRRLTPRFLKPPAPRRRLRRPLLLHCLQARRCCIFALACSTPPPVHRLFCPSEGARRDSHHASAFTTGKAACLVVV